MSNPTFWCPLLNKECIKGLIKHIGMHGVYCNWWVPELGECAITSISVVMMEESNQFLKERG